MAFENVKRSVWRCVGLALAVVIGPGIAAAQSTTGQQQPQQPSAQQPQQPSTAQKPAQASSGPVYYPSKGQSQEQQAKDKNECYGWATQQTGYDPVAAAQAQQGSQQQGQQKGGGAVGGAAKGAAAGAAVGAIAGDAGKGAAAGAAAGGIGGGARKKKQEAAKQQAATEQQQAQSQELAQYQKAVGTCMQGRGYAVSQ